MQIFATFDYSSFLELALTDLESKGVTDIYAVPLDARQEKMKVMDSLHRADGISLMDKGLIFAFLLATIGASKGFEWRLGPVIWGLIGAVSGFLLGVAINLLLMAAKRKRDKRRLRQGKKAEVIVVVTCEARDAAMVEDVLWEHFALGVAKTR